MSSEASGSSATRRSNASVSTARRRPSGLTMSGRLTTVRATLATRSVGNTPRARKSSSASVSPAVARSVAPKAALSATRASTACISGANSTSSPYPTSESSYQPVGAAQRCSNAKSSTMSSSSLITTKRFERAAQVRHSDVSRAERVQVIMMSVARMAAMSGIQWSSRARTAEKIDCIALAAAGSLARRRRRSAMVRRVCQSSASMRSRR